jgi:hypothetical protein
MLGLFPSAADQRACAQIARALVRVGEWRVAAALRAALEDALEEMAPLVPDLFVRETDAERAEREARADPNEPRRPGVPPTREVVAWEGAEAAALAVW